MMKARTAVGSTVIERKARGNLGDNSYDAVVLSDVLKSMHHR